MRRPSPTLLALATVVIGTAPASAQIFFVDGFNRGTPGSPVPGPGGAYTEVVTAGDGDARLLTNSFLDITNDGSGAGEANGRTYLRSTYGGGFTNLNATTGTVQWTFNMRYNRTTAPSGFATGEYGVAVVLTATNTDYTQGNGYAVVYGQGGADPIKLVSYTGGLDANGNLTDIITAGATQLANVNNFASVRVTFRTSDNRWQLFVRDDGAAAWGTGHANTQVGVDTIDTAGFINSGDNPGFFWNYSTAAAQSAQFDNMTFFSVPEPVGIALGGVAASGMGFALLRRARRTKAATQAQAEVTVEDEDDPDLVEAE